MNRKVDSHTLGAAAPAIFSWQMGVGFGLSRFPVVYIICATSALYTVGHFVAGVAEGMERAGSELFEVYTIWWELTGQPKKVGQGMGQPKKSGPRNVGTEQALSRHYVGTEQILDMWKRTYLSSSACHFRVAAGRWFWFVAQFPGRYSQVCWRDPPPYTYFGGRCAGGTLHACL